jgi:hypothetical protein
LLNLTAFQGFWVAEIPDYGYHGKQDFDMKNKRWYFYHIVVVWHKINFITICDSAFFNFIHILWCIQKMIFRSFQWCSSRKSWKSIKISESWKSRWIKTKQSAMQLSQIRRTLKLCNREIIFRFEMNLQNFIFLNSSIQICIFMQVPKYLGTGL